MQQAKPRFRGGQGFSVAAVAAALVLIAVLPFVAEMYAWLEVTLQVASTLAGIFLGVYLQRVDDAHKADAAARIALGNVIAMASSIRHLGIVMVRARERAQEDPAESVAEARRSTGALLSGIDGHLNALRAQVQASADAWTSYAPGAQSFLDDKATAVLAEADEEYLS